MSKTKEPRARLWAGEINYIKNEMPPNLTVLEIGTWQGGSALLFSERASTVITIDVFNIDRVCDKSYDSDEMLDYSIQETHENIKNTNNIILMVGLSSQIVPLFQDSLFDFIFIDGDHTYEGIKTDTEICLPKLKNDGMIMYHDYDLPSNGRIEVYNYINDTYNVNNGLMVGGSIIFKKKDRII